jgi:glutamyl-tRNA synthetase
MHMGNIRSALLGWLWAQMNGGQFLLRIEDLDFSRCKSEFTDEIFRDLEYLGLNWNGPVWHQSQRGAIYDEYVHQLKTKGSIYECVCTRAEIARASSAPHVGEEGPRYPATCRNRTEATTNKTPALRFKVAEGIVSFTDEVYGDVSQNVNEVVGDFVVRKNDGIASYQLAVVVDDALSEVTHVIRGDDLLSSTPRQLLLYQAFNFAPPVFAHVPLLINADGKRMAKRDGAFTLKYFREKKVPAEMIVGHLGYWSGLLSKPTSISAIDLAREFSFGRISREPTVIREGELLAIASERSPQ